MAGMVHGAWCHVEIPTSDEERAQKFYAEVFGWTFVSIPEMSYTMYSVGDSEIGGGLMKQQPGMPMAFMNYINVDSHENTTAAIERAGGKIVQPKFEVPGTGWITIVQDTEGNVFGLWKSMTPPRAAKPAKKSKPAAKKKKAAKKKPAKAKGGRKKR